MHLRPPKLRRHRPPHGQFIAEWANRTHYFGHDPVAAREAFESPTSPHPGALHRWHAWAAQRRLQGTAPTSSAARHHHPLLIDATEEMLRDYLNAGRPDTARRLRHHLGRFMHIHGAADLVELASPDPKRGRYAPPIIALLNAFIADSARASRTHKDKKKRRKGNKTINHDVGAVKRLFTWSAQQGLCPAVPWLGVKKLATRRGTPDVLEVDELCALIARAGGAEAGSADGLRPAEGKDKISAGAHRRSPVPRAEGHQQITPSLRAADDDADEPTPIPDLVPWLALNYLCTLRPSEVITLIHGRYEVIRATGIPEDGRQGLIVKLLEHKSSWRGESAYDRHIVLTPESLAWLRIARPRWHDLKAYSKACRAAGCPKGPSRMRDSSASHLRRRGVPAADVDLLLGHARSGEWKSYVEAPWKLLMKMAGRITLQSSTSQTSSSSSPRLGTPEEWARKIRASGPLVVRRKPRSR